MLLRTATLLVLALTATIARAQPAPTRHKPHTFAWTVIGAGAGFGVGLVAGLDVFDDAINSDRKVWTTAIASAAAGGAIAYLLSRPRRSTAQPTPQRLTDGEARALASGFRFVRSP
jgi:hypothetical protein